MKGGNGIRIPKSHRQQDMGACAVTKGSQIHWLQIDLQDQLQGEWISAALQSKTCGAGISSKRSYRLL